MRRIVTGVERASRFADENRDSRTHYRTLLIVDTDDPGGFKCREHMQTKRSRCIAAVQAGASYRDAARMAEVSISTVWRWVHLDLPDPPRRNPHLPPCKRRKLQRAIEAGHDSLRRIAVQHGVHVATVCRIRDSMDACPYRRRPRRCDRCGGRVTTARCLLCRARLYRPLRNPRRPCRPSSRCPAA